MIRNRISRLQKFLGRIREYKKTCIVFPDGRTPRLSKTEEARALRAELNKTATELLSLFTEARSFDDSIQLEIHIGPHVVPIFRTAFSSGDDPMYVSRSLNAAVDVVSATIGYWSDKREIIRGTVEEKVLDDFIQVKDKLKDLDAGLYKKLGMLEAILKIDPPDINNALNTCRLIVLEFYDRGIQDKTVLSSLDENKDINNKRGEKNVAAEYLAKVGIEPLGIEVMREIYDNGSSGKGTPGEDKLRRALLLLQVLLNEYVDVRQGEPQKLVK